MEIIDNSPACIERTARYRESTPMQQWRRKWGTKKDKGKSTVVAVVGEKAHILGKCDVKQ